jgi:hypothetical protein
MQAQSANASLDAPTLLGKLIPNRLQNRILARVHPLV